MKQEKVKLLKKQIGASYFRVAIFGSARIKRDDKNYRLIYQLAKMIGEENLDIVTGGGPGTMEAADAGHKEGNKRQARSYGLLIKLPKAQKTNKHLDLKKEFSIFSDRLDQFMALSNVVVVAPGGIGTTLELFYAWQLVQVEQICDMPIILLGKQWIPLINWVKNNLLKQKYIDKKDLDSIFIAKDINEAMDIINKTYEQFEKGGKNVCVNLKKYRLK